MLDGGLHWFYDIVGVELNAHSTIGFAGLDNSIKPSSTTSVARDWGAILSSIMYKQQGQNRRCKSRRQQMTTGDNS
jgi:hypothetical protein